MRKKLELFIIFILFTETVLYPKSVEAALPSGIKLEDVDEEFDDFKDEQENLSNNFIFDIFSPGEVLYETHEGFDDLNDSIDIANDAVFEWGSITKLLTWVSVMQLAEEDLIDLEEDIDTYLPDDLLQDFVYDEPVTMIDLMNHQGGFQDYIPTLFVPEVPDDYSLENEITENQPTQIYEPGEVTAYSNWGAALAGYIVEEVSGQPFYEYVHENILNPLDMNHTALSIDLSDNPEVRERRDEADYFSSEDDARYMPLYPAGSAVGTLPDLVTFAQALFPSNKNSVLFDEDSTLISMFEATDTYGDTDAARNAHGLQVTHFDHPVYGHRGNTYGFSTQLLLDIQEETGYIAIANEVQETSYTVLFPEVIFGEYADSDSFEDMTPVDLSMYRSTPGYIQGVYSVME
jgi:CubicO group peptidase (beta-lactamase class C family)